MDAVEVVETAIAQCYGYPQPGAVGTDDDGWYRRLADVALAALLALGDGDPVVLMPADEDGTVEVRRAATTGHRTSPYTWLPEQNYRLVPIEDGEGT